jgi:hypothetical protein
MFGPSQVEKLESLFLELNPNFKRTDVGDIHDVFGYQRNYVGL